MKNPERFISRRYDTPNRCEAFTSKVYSGPSDDKPALVKAVFSTEKTFYPEAPKYNLYYGELHGHSKLSDGQPTVDDYYKQIRDNAGLDFAALSDHDHGGVGNAELFGEKWEIMRAKAREYDEPGKFSVILAYERDSYPWYNNMVIYYRDYDGEAFRGKTDGELDREMLLDMLNRDDVIVVPHDTYSLEAGADFNTIPSELLTPLIEIWSRGDSAEYFGNPQNEQDIQCEGGFWQDALKRGAKMGCIAASDDHQCFNGITCEGGRWKYSGLSIYPGITGVWAEENTHEAIFDALKKRRCYGFTGGRVSVDFRINGHYMGEEFDHRGVREIYYCIKADANIKRVTVVKNCRDYMLLRRAEQFFYDYNAENDTDLYYLRVELEDGRCAWTSPIWISNV